MASEETKTDMIEVGVNNVELYKNKFSLNSTEIVPIELFDEFGKEVKITKNQISKTLSNGKLIKENNIVILGNDGNKDKEIATYIDIKPYAAYIDSKGETVYYPATNENDDVKAIEISLKDDNISSFEESKKEFEDAGLVRI